MSESLCTCGHLPHIFSCWGDNGECACREHAPSSEPKAMMPNGFQADLSSFSRDEHGVYYRPAEPVQKVDETKSKYVVAFDAHDGFWWALGAGKALPGMNPVEALQALLLAITGEALLRG